MKRKLLVFMVTLVLCMLVSSLALAGVVVKQGMRGDYVRCVQELLIEQGYLSGEADGICGPQTAEAIKKFQQKHDLEADGICGPKTLELLDPDGRLKEIEPAYGTVVYVEATGYSAYDPGNSQYTSTGELLRHGIIAVDPSFIPLGTRVYIPGYGEAVAADVGWGIKGNLIDVAFDTHEEALAFGRQELQITVYDR